VVQQFARVLARDGELRVLLLDMHVDRPTIEVDAARRLAFCSGASRRGAAGEPGEPVEHLHALPVPAELRSRVYPAETARELLDSVAGAYDWIVIDGPPVLEAPDAATLAAIADAVVMVVRAGRTKRPVLARAVEVLRKNGARVVGSVLNRRQLEIPEFIYRRI
jgi:cellulose biosynthesis protein BcsQ